MILTTDFLIGIGVGFVASFILEELIKIVNTRMYNKILLEVADRFRKLRDMSDEELSKMLGEDLLNSIRKEIIGEDKQDEHN